MSAAENIEEAFRRDPVPATFLTFGVLDLLPVPTDIGFIYTRRYLERRRDKMSEVKYEVLQGINYFGWDAAWYGSLAAVTYKSNASTSRKIEIGGAIVCTGAIVALLWYLFSKKEAT